MSVPVFRPHEEHSAFVKDKYTNGLYTVDFKLHVLDWYHENGGRKGETCRKFQVNPKTLQNWILLEKQLRSGTPIARISAGVRQQIEKKLFDWFKQQKGSGQVIIHTQTLRAKALEIATDIGIPTFKASRTWIKQWKKQYNVDVGMIDDDEEGLVHVVTLSPPSEDEDGYMNDEHSPELFERKVLDQPSRDETNTMLVNGSQNRAGDNQTVGSAESNKGFPQFRLYNGAGQTLVFQVSTNHYMFLVLAL